MAFALDPQVKAALASMIAAMADAAPPPVGDVQTRRQTTEATMAQTAAAQPMPTDVTTTDDHTVAADGAQILLRWCVKDGAAPGSAVFYLHGGGMIMGSVALYDGLVARYVSHGGAPMLSVDYRRAPEHPHPTPSRTATRGCAGSARTPPSWASTRPGSRSWATAVARAWPRRSPCWPATEAALRWPGRY